MGRVVRDWSADERVEAATVAPHRYRWDREDHEQPDMEYKAWHAAVAYKAGEVVYLDVDGEAKKARVLYVWRERNHLGEYRAKYRVQLETKAGTWSQQWVYTWPGFIQRGYQLAGLAPDMPPRREGR